MIVASSPLLTIKEVASRLGVSVFTVYDWAASGRVPVVRFGRRTIRVRAEVLERMEREGLPQAAPRAA